MSDTHTINNLDGLVYCSECHKVVTNEAKHTHTKSNDSTTRSNTVTTK